MVEGPLIQVQLEFQNSQVPQVARFQWQGRISKSRQAVREVSEVNDVMMTHLHDVNIYHLNVQVRRKEDC